MPKAMIITVGGSDKPVVNAIKGYKEQIDIIYFICSGGKGNVSSRNIVEGEGKVIKAKRCPKCKEIIEGEDRENILKQSEYSGKYEIVEISDPDDIEEVHQKISTAISELENKGYKEIIADFTGGTKTMSAVLSMLAVSDFSLKLSLVKGQRRNLERINGESFPEILNVDFLRVEDKMKYIDLLISHYFYYPARIMIENLLKEDFAENLKKKIRYKLSLCKAFNYWDMFEYEKAFDTLKDFAEDERCEQHFKYLLKILGKDKNTGYEKVFDLISNARRQASNGYYDNAVVRLYRALELFAQIRLKSKYNVDSSALEKSLDKLKIKEENKNKWRERKNEKNEIKLGVKDDYELLSQLQDEFGKIYSERKNEFNNHLQKRNSSKLAHGDKPITKELWNDFFKFCKQFIISCLEKINLKSDFDLDFPTEF